jgi:hypothetical protein
MNMTTTSRAIAAAIAALACACLPVAAITTAPAAGAAVFCNSYGGAGWTNTLCTGGGTTTFCNSYGPGTNGGGPFGRPNGAGDWSNTTCN